MSHGLKLTLFYVLDLNGNSYSTVDQAIRLIRSKLHHLVKSAAPAVLVAVKTPSLVTLYRAEP
jgi:hypothetical protein